MDPDVALKLFDFDYVSEDNLKMVSILLACEATSGICPIVQINKPVEINRFFFSKDICT